MRLWIATCMWSPDNPALTQFGYNDNAIRIKGTLTAPNVQGNTKGEQKGNKNTRNTHGTTLITRNCQSKREKSNNFRWEIITYINFMCF